MSAPSIGEALSGAGGVALTHERRRICLEALYELSGWADQLRCLVPLSADGNYAFVARGMACRIDVLAGVLMSGLADEAVPMAELQERLFGIQT